MRCMGKSNKQIARLVNLQIAIKLSAPMVMALLIILFCVPLLNGKMNFILPVSLNNILLKLTGEFGACIVIFYICYFGIASAMSKQYINKKCSSKRIKTSRHMKLAKPEKATGIANDM